MLKIKRSSIAFSLTGLAILMSGAVYAQDTQVVKTTPRLQETEPIVSRLSVARVKEIAAERVSTNGFPVRATDPWNVALQVREKGYVWAAYLLLPDSPSPFLIYIDDATESAEFLTPLLHLEQNSAVDDADWLFKVSDALKQIRFPVEIEVLMQAARFPDAKPTGGGRTINNRPYLEYTLREDKDSSERFEVRCYYSEVDGDAAPKMVTSAELAYADAKGHRYLLIARNE